MLNLRDFAAHFFGYEMGKIRKCREPKGSIDKF